MINRSLLSRAWPILPALAWLSLFCLVPVVFIAMASLGHRTESGSIEFGLTLEHYWRFLSSRFYLGVLWRSLYIGMAVTVCTVLVGYPVAYLFSTVRRSTRALLIALLIVPWWCNILVKNFAWIALLGEKGVLNAALQNLGIISSPLILVHNEAAVVLGLVHVLLPFVVLPIYSSLEKIDPRLTEASANLGAGAARSFLEVTLPLSMPGVLAGSILTLVLAIGAYITPLLLGSERTVMISKIIEEQTIEAAHLPFGSAIAMVLLVVVIGLIATLNRAVGLERVLGAGK